MSACPVCGEIRTEIAGAHRDRNVTPRMLVRWAQRRARHTADCPDPATAEAAERAIGRRFGTPGAWSR